MMEVRHTVVFDLECADFESVRASLKNSNAHP